MSVEYTGIHDVCYRHADRLQWALGQIKPLLPLTEKTLLTLDDVQLAIVDQLVARFSKLQDAMGAKLLPFVLELTKEQGEMPTFIDKLHRLEKIGAIESANDWLVLREMRNAFAHDYPTEPDVQAALLNKAATAADQLLATLHRVDSFAQRYLP